MSDKLNTLVEDLGNLSVLDGLALVRTLEKKWDVSAVAATPAIVIAEPVVEAVEKKTVFTVVLKSAGAAKLPVIKEVRAFTALGLKEAKDLVDSAPSTIKTDVPEADAIKIQAALQALGAMVELE